MKKSFFPDEEEKVKKRTIKRHQENNQSTRNRAPSRLGDGGDHRESMGREMILPRTTEVGRGPWAPGEKLYSGQHFDFSLVRPRPGKPAEPPALLTFRTEMIPECSFRLLNLW